MTMPIATDVDPRVREFERALDAALEARGSVVGGGNTALVLAANVCELAAAERSAVASHLAKGLKVLAPTLINRPGGDIPIESLISDLLFSGHYYSLRELLYYTYNAPGSITWKFDGTRVTVAYADPSLPRQFFIAANNWFLESAAIFPNKEPVDRIDGLLRGAPEFELNDRAKEALGLIREEARTKLNNYFDFVLDRSVTIGNYSLGDAVTVLEALLTKALYHRYHARLNSSHGVITMRLEDIAADIAADFPISLETAAAVVADVAYGPEARAAGLQPMHFSLYHLLDGPVVMLPHDFATWEGMVSLLRLTALRDPTLFLSNVSNKLGDGLVRYLAKELESAGFVALQNLSLAAWGLDLPDIDLLVISAEPTLGFVVLAIEVKSPIPPQWAKDQLRVTHKDSIPKAFGQLARIRDFLSSPTGISFLVDRLVASSSLNQEFDEYAVAVHSLVVTSDNAGAFFEGNPTVIDFRTFTRLLRRCDGDIAYVLRALREIPSWADAALATIPVEVSVGQVSVSYEGVTIKHLMDFGQAAFQSAGVPQRLLQAMLDDGARPLDGLVVRGPSLSD